MRMSPELRFPPLWPGGDNGVGAAESGGKECSDQFPGERMADHEAPEADHVQIVVFDALVRRKDFMNQAGPHPHHFVRDDRCSNATSADSHAAIHFPEATARAKGTTKSG